MRTKEFKEMCIEIERNASFQFDLRSFECARKHIFVRK